MAEQKTAERQRDPVDAAIAPPSGDGKTYVEQPAPRVAAPAAGVAASAKPVKPPEPPKLEDRFFYSCEQKQNAWFVISYKKHTLDDILRKDYWAYVARKLQPGNKIAVMSEDCRMYVELIVFGTGSNWAEVQVLNGPLMVDHALNTIDTDYKIENRGLIKQWCVIRTSDDREIKADGSLRTKEQAQTWLREWLHIEGRRVA
jgi:hypothetical protein